jgi:tetratricopeptide (TPR) repeat protein
MKRWSGILAALVLLPATAQAQKRPSNNMHTRSADVYLKQAQDARVVTDRNQLFEKAANAALEGTKSEPDNPKPWFQLGVAHAGMGNLAAADSAFDKAEQIYPEYATEIDPVRQSSWITAYNQGVQALQGGDQAAALRSLELANSIYQKRPEALVMLASLHLQAGDLPKAERTFNDALTVLRSPARKALKPDQAKEWEEDETTVALRLSSIYAELGRNDDAIKVYRDLLTSQPQNLMAKANLAVVLTRAGKADESQAIYRELLSRDDIPENTLFNIGVGLFRAEAFDESARAFRRAAALNPHSHETMYNLAQALLGLASKLEKQQPPPAAELKKTYEEMRSIAETLHRLDPANRNVLMMLAQSQRSLAELTGQNPQGDELRKQVLATLQKAEALPFDVSEIRIVPGKDDVQIVGKVTTLKGAAGTPVKLRFSIMNREGAELSSHEVSVNLAAKDESTRFDTRVKVPEGASAWKYVIVGS